MRRSSGPANPQTPALVFGVIPADCATEPRATGRGQAGDAVSISSSRDLRERTNRPPSRFKLDMLLDVSGSARMLARRPISEIAQDRHHWALVDEDRLERAQPDEGREQVQPLEREIPRRAMPSPPKKTCSVGKLPFKWVYSSGSLEVLCQKSVPLNLITRCPSLSLAKLPVPDFELKRNSAGRHQHERGDGRPLRSFKSMTCLELLRTAGQKWNSLHSPPERHPGLKSNDFSAA